MDKRWGTVFGYVKGGKYLSCYVGKKNGRLTFWECGDTHPSRHFAIPKSCLADVPFSEIESYERVEKSDSISFRVIWNTGEQSDICAEKTNANLPNIEKAMTKALQ